MLFNLVYVFLSKPPPNSFSLSDLRVTSLLLCSRGNTPISKPNEKLRVRGELWNLEKSHFSKHGITVSVLWMFGGLNPNISTGFFFCHFSTIWQRKYFPTLTGFDDIWLADLQYVTENLCVQCYMFKHIASAKVLQVTVNLYLEASLPQERRKNWHLLILSVKQFAPSSSFKDEVNNAV